MLVLLCQLVRVQVLQGAALQEVAQCHAYLLSLCNIFLAEVNELDIRCPHPAQQTELLCTPSPFLSPRRQPEAQRLYG